MKWARAPVARSTDWRARHREVANVLGGALGSKLPEVHEGTAYDARGPIAKAPEGVIPTRG